MFNFLTNKGKTMKTKLMLSLLLSVPVATHAMQEVQLEDLESGTMAKGPLADFMQSCGVANEEELAKRVRGRVERIDRHGHDAIIKGLTYLANFRPDALAQLQPVIARKRTGTDEPADQVGSLSAAVDILEGINGALVTGVTIADNWNGTSTVSKIEAILSLTVATLAKLEDKAGKTGCWGRFKKQPKPAAAAPVAQPAVAPAPQPVAAVTPAN